MKKRKQDVELMDEDQELKPREHPELVAAGVAFIGAMAAAGVVGAREVKSILQDDPQTRIEAAREQNERLAEMRDQIKQMFVLPEATKDALVEKVKSKFAPSGAKEDLTAAEPEPELER